MSLAGVTLDQLVTVDCRYFTNFALRPKENLRSALSRMQFKANHFNKLYAGKGGPLATRLMGGYGSFEDAAVAVLKDALRGEHGSDKYGIWLTTKGTGVTYDDFKNLAADEPLQTGIKRRVVSVRSPGASTGTKSDSADKASSDEEEDADPVFAATTGGPIAKETISGVCEQLAPMFKDHSQKLDSINTRLDSHEEAFSNLAEEHKILRQGLNTRNANPESFAQQAAVTPRDSREPQSSRTLALPNVVAAANNTYNGAPRGKFNFKKRNDNTTNSKPEAAKRDPIVWDELPKPWQDLVQTLLNESGKKMEDECVICCRNGKWMYNGTSHATIHCGLLWTLTKAGLAWLLARRQQNGDSAKAAALLAAAHAYDPNDLEAVICSVCDGDDAMDTWTNAVTTQFNGLEDIVASLAA